MAREHDDTDRELEPSHLDQHHSTQAAHAEDVEHEGHTEPDEQTATTVSTDASWAKARREAVYKTSSHVFAQRKALEADAWLVIGTLRASAEMFSAFEERYGKAKRRFETKIEDYLEAAQQKREDIEAMFDLVLGVVPETKLLSAIKHVHETIGTIGNVMTVAHVKPVSLGEEVKPAKAVASDKTRLKWRPLVDHSVDMFEGFVGTSGQLTSLDHVCDSAIHDLSDAVEGKDVAPDLEARTRGLVRLSLPGSTGALPDALAFFLDTTAKLASQTDVDIERRLAEQWIAELRQNQVTSALTDVQPYLEQIGVIGPNSSKGLRIDPHGDEMIDATADHEQLMMWVRAQVKVEAEASVGRSVQWMGGFVRGDEIVGSVKLDGNDVSAVGRGESRDGTCIDKAVTEQGGGRVKIVKARWLDTPIEVTSNWAGRNIKDYLASMRMSQVQLTVEGTATTGTDLVDDTYQGPSMSAARPSDE